MLPQVTHGDGQPPRQSIKAPKNLLSSADRPYVVEFVLEVLVRIATAQVHVPREARIARVRSTRPVEA